MDFIYWYLVELRFKSIKGGMGIYIQSKKREKEETEIEISQQGNLNDGEIGRKKLGSLDLDLDKIFISQNIDLYIWKTNYKRNILNKHFSTEGCGNTSLQDKMFK